MVNKLKCECGNPLRLQQSYSGADWNSKAGAGSGHNYELTLNCDSCGNVYEIGYLKNLADFSEPLADRRPYK